MRWNGADETQLIQTQHEHETQWCAGRRELAMKIEARKVGQKKLDDVLCVPSHSLNVSTANILSDAQSAAK